MINFLRCFVLLAGFSVFSSAHLFAQAPVFSIQNIKKTCEGAVSGPSAGSFEVVVTSGVPDITITVVGPAAYIQQRFNVNIGDPILFDGLRAGNYSVTVSDDNDIAFTSVNIQSIATGISITLDNLTNSTDCANSNGSIEITVSGGDGNYIFEWTGPNGYTNNTEDISNLGPGDYNLVVTETTTNCSNAVGPFTITEPVTPDASNPVDNEYCEGQALTAIAVDNPGAGFTVNWYDAPSLGVLVGTGFSFIPPSSGTYYAELVDNVTNCVSVNRVAATLIENPYPPDAANPVNNDYCQGEPLTLISVDDPGAGFSVNWYDAAIAGNLVHTGNSFIPASAGTYYAEVVNNTTGCASANRIAVTLTENPLPADATNPVGNSYCAGEALTAISVDNPGAGLTVNWYDAATNGNLMGTGFSFTPATAGTFYAEVVNDATTCISANRVAVTLNENPLPADATNPVGNSYCAGEALTTISVDDPGAGFTVNWYDASSNGNLVGTGFNFTPAAPGAFYAEIENDLTGCTSANRVAVTLTENPLPADATNPADNSYCAGEALTAISVDNPGAGFTVNWYDAATNGNLMGTGFSFIPATAGTFYAEVVNDATTCISANRVAATLTESPLPADATNPVGNSYCAGEALTAISVDNPGAGFTVNWYDASSNGNLVGIGFSFTPAAAGTYYAEVENDLTGCVSVNRVAATLTENPLPANAANPVNGLYCTGDPIPGISVDDPGAGFEVNWFTVATGGTVVFTGPVYNPGADGSYYAEIRNTVTGCISAGRVAVVISEVGIASADITENLRCASAFNGAISLSMVGDSNDYTFDWTGPDAFSSSDQNISGLAAGTYDVIVTYVPTGCTISESYVVTENLPVLGITETITNNTRCIATFNGAIEVDITGATGALSFSWTGPGGFASTNQNISQLAAGTYSLTVTDVNSGCTLTDDFEVIEDAEQPQLTEAITDNTNCTAPFNGAIDISVSPAGTYTYAWTGPNGFTSNSQDISNLAPGDYEVTVSNTTTACVVTEIYTVQDNSSVIDVTLNNTTGNDACNFPFNGAVSINVSPAGFYTYAWAGPNGFTSVNQNISGVQHGDYTVTVSNTSGCVQVETFTVADDRDAPLIQSSTVTDNNNCQAPFNGAISITATGGSGNYTFAWVGPNAYSANTSNITDLAAGTYIVTITDDSGCANAFDFTVNNDTPPINITLNNSTANDNCQAPYTGSLTISVSGTAGPYSFEWTGPDGFTSTQQNIANLVHGDYTITVTDDTEGCVAVATFNVVDNTPVLSISIDNNTENTSCSEPFNGAIDISLTGGSGNYLFDWTGPDGFTASTASIAGLAAGAYTITVTDQDLGCIVTEEIIVDNNTTPILADETIVPNTACESPFDGSISLSNITGTPGPFSFDWAGPNGFSADTQNISALASGTYSLTITDDVLGCSSILEFIVPDNTPALVLTETITDNTNCVIPFSGAIEIINISGGSGDYSFNWTGPDGFTANAQDIDELASGTYQLIVTDDVSGCSATYSYIVADNIAGISISPVAVNANTSCTSPFNGSIEIDITGSAGPFTFAWTGPAGFTANTQNINSLQPGNYNVIVTDDVQGCTASITLNVANDATGCEGLDCEAFTVSITDTRPTCVNQDDGQIVFNVAGGSGTYIVTLFANNFTQAIPGTGPTFTFNNLSPANYQYTIQDGAGNTCTLPYTLLLESLLDAQITEFSDALCFNEPTGAATIQVFSGGTPPYQYSLDAVNWVNFVSPVTIDDLMPSPNPFTILVRNDENDLCPAQLLVQIGNLTTAITASLSSTSTTCENTGGSVIVNSVGGGAGNYTYRFNGVDYNELPAANTFTNLSAGNYTFTVIDGLGCARDFPVSVAFPDFIPFNVATIGPECVPDYDNGRMFVEVNAIGTFEVSIRFSNQSTIIQTQSLVSAGNGVALFDGLIKSTYVVSVSGGTLCPNQETVTISTGPDQVNFTASAVNPVCFETPAAIQLSNISGASATNYNYEVIRSGNVVSSGTITAAQALTSFLIDGLATGEYAVRLTQDQSATSGCSDLIESDFQIVNLLTPIRALDTLYTQKRISVPDLPSGALTVGIQESGSGGYQARLELIQPLFGGQSFVQDWTNIPINANSLRREIQFRNIYAGTYQLSIRDDLGCVKVYEIFIDFDSSIFIPNVFTPNGDGVNDIFFIRNLPQNGNVKLLITNRWGKRVYLNENYQNNWDADGLADGIYYYRLDTGTESFNGWVEVLRGQ